jgi:hypothetical protein
MLIADGEDPQWWDAEIGGNFLGEGDTLFLNNVAITTSYWVEDISEYALPEEKVGKESHNDSNEYNGDSFNGGIIFDCMAPFTLNSVLMYTDTEGERLVELLDNNGAVVNSLLVNVPVSDTAGIRIDLDFEVMPGFDYQLTTNGDQNDISFGHNSPRLKRNNSGASYNDYVVEDILQMTNSVGGGSSRYYYFYDWEVQPASTFCTSDRVEAQVVVGPVSTFNIDNSNDVQLFPNPSNGDISFIIDFDAEKVSVKMTDLSGKIVHFQTLEQVTKSNPQHLNLSNLAKGVYFVQLLVGEDIYNGKVILQ